MAMMRRGRILVLSDYIGAGGPSAGGAGIAALDSYQALRRAGIDTHLVTGFALPEALAADPNAESLGGADLRGQSPAQAMRTIHNPASMAAIKPVLAKFDPDHTIIMLHQWTRYLSPSVIAGLRRYRVMVYMHDYFWACPNGAYFDFKRSEPCRKQPMGLSCLTTNCDRGGYGHKAGRAARDLRRRSAARGFDHERLYLHVSQQAKRVAQQLLPDGHHATLYNPIGLANAASVLPSHAKRDVGYFGRLEPEKGIEKLLASLSRRGMTALFVGAGSLAARIDATPGMTRLPWQPRDRMADLMRSCRLIALPSLWPETWGLVTAEAMAAGVPVLVSSRAGSAELIERFGGGFTFDPGSEAALDAILDLLVSGIEILPLSPSRQIGLLALLSPANHAARLIRLAARTWDIDIGPSAAEEPRGMSG